MMKTRFLLIQLALIILISSCQGQNDEQVSKSNGIHEIVVQEVIQTSNYTYILGKEGDKNTWLAAPLTTPKLGGTYYHDGGMEMRNFKSKELGREFELIYFIGKLGTSPEDLKNVSVKGHNQTKDPHEGHNHGHMHSEQKSTGSKNNIEKSSVKIEPAEGGITLAELFANKEENNGKKVIIKGKVVKFNAAIMNRNWIHIQDGTEHNGKFDLTVTSNIECNVGDVVTFEGKITLNKDFGYGYKYDVLMEEAVKK